MRKLLFGVLMVCLVAFSVVWQQVGADEAPAGFTALFNGKDLTGWKVAKGESLEGKTEVKNNRFQVADGTLVIDGKTKGNLVIESVKEFDRDVQIRFEFLPDEKCNNDLYFRGNKFDIKKGDVKNLKPGEWHLFEIVVKGDAVEFKCNGETQRTGKVKAASPLGIRAEFGAITFRKMGYKE